MLPNLPRVVDGIPVHWTGAAKRMGRAQTMGYIARVGVLGDQRALITVRVLPEDLEQAYARGGQHAVHEHIAGLLVHAAQTYRNAPALPVLHLDDVDDLSGPWPPPEDSGLHFDRHG